MQEFNFDNKTLYDLNVISSLDYHLARTLCHLGEASSRLIEFSLCNGFKIGCQGHICLDIEQLHQKPLDFEGPDGQALEFLYPQKKEWLDALQHSPLVSDGIGTPLVLDRHNKLYLSKYYDFQNRLTRNIKQRIGTKTDDPEQWMIEKIHQAYPSKGTGSKRETEAFDVQKQAIINALKYPFSIISGGPGTGKTFIIRILIRLLENLPFKSKTPSKILCVAPTGKAAAKLKNGMTIHRALGVKDDRNTYTYHKDHLLPFDVVVIDEASMIDIALMTRLLEAIPLTSKIILVGDHHQLTSVETGAVFEDICLSESMNKLTTVLEYNFRSRAANDIDRISKAIYQGDSPAVLDFLLSADMGQVIFMEFRDDGVSEDRIARICLDGYLPFMEEQDPVKALEKLDDFKILTPTRSGPMGTGHMNEMCKNILRSRLNFDIQDRFFKRAVMITKNDYQHNLFNGDSGVVFCENNRLISVFRDTDNHVAYFDPDILSGIEDAFAITIHKSQGSEYDHVLMILPPGSSPFINRQLLYTGFTRARRKVTLIGSKEAISQACRLSTKRFSNITGLLDDQC